MGSGFRNGNSDKGNERKLQERALAIKFQDKVIPIKAMGGSFRRKPDDKVSG